MKEIIFYSYGDSNKASTWSNVPYLFTKELENRGILVRRIDISPNRFINKIWQLTVAKFLNCFYPNHEYSWIRTSLFRWLTEWKIKKSVALYHTADYCFVTCFDYYNRFSDIPTLLFSDWTYNILIQSQKGRELYSIEKPFARQQAEAYPNANIRHLGENVINNLCGTKYQTEELISKKVKSDIILFIGQKKYIEGAKLLIHALMGMRDKGKDYQLHIIGMRENDFCQLPDFVKCYGYLHKDIPEENRLYYQLMTEAKLFVNPTPVWAGFSSMIEAMYFATPIVVSPYEDFVATFGKEISFGCYNNVFREDSLIESIEYVLNNEKMYAVMCREAHRVTEGYTWKAYVDKLLKAL